ncbi:MAG TPA: septal ring lytic transglycosylase RlpA family protein [Anaeromyxobacteraceae bacterium]|nr:septal ring lytic transglycosylase RlpA family protein [Anaeromyxobacteraceae bacterium]
MLASRRASFAAVALLVVVGSGCAGARRAGAPPTSAPGLPSLPADPGDPGDDGVPDEEVGLASYYGRAHQGKPTASGVPFDMNAMTAAHRRHPFGARLRVTDLETGKTVDVKVNDRGPFVKDRIIDVSYAAARALGFLGRGVARVKVKRVD